MRTARRRLLSAAVCARLRCPVIGSHLSVRSGLDHVRCIRQSASNHERNRETHAILTVQSMRMPARAEAKCNEALIETLGDARGAGPCALRLGTTKTS